MSIYIGAALASEVGRNGSLVHLASVARLFVRDVDIVSNMSRIFSVLAADESCCDAMGSSPQMRSMLLPTFHVFLTKYPGRQDVVVRVAYVLGNLMAKRDEARVEFFNVDGAPDSLLDLLSIYVRKDIGGAATNSLHKPAGQSQDGMGKNMDEDSLSAVSGDGSSGTPTDVIIKVIRVLANMSIAGKVGMKLAGNHRLETVKHQELQKSPPSNSNHHESDGDKQTFEY